MNSNDSVIIFDQKIISKLFKDPSEKSSKACGFYHKLYKEFGCYDSIHPTMLFVELIGINTGNIKKQIVSRNKTKLKNLRVDEVHDVLERIIKSENEWILNTYMTKKGIYKKIRSFYDKYKKNSKDIRSEWVKQLFRNYKNDLNRKKFSLIKVISVQIIFEALIQISKELPESEKMKGIEEKNSYYESYLDFLRLSWWKILRLGKISPILLSYSHIKPTVKKLKNLEIKDSEINIVEKYQKCDFHQSDSGDSEYLWYLCGEVNTFDKKTILITADDINTIIGRLHFSLTGLIKLYNQYSDKKLKFNFGVVIQINTESWVEIDRVDLQQKFSQYKEYKEYL